jgi:integrase
LPDQIAARGERAEKLIVQIVTIGDGNALEALAFCAKDALFVIDDFAPQGSSTDVARYHAAADRVSRAAGNHAGRSRLDSTAKLREPKPPRALILSTGEDIPRRPSVRARLLILELTKSRIDVNDLTARQENAREDLYAEAMGGFVRWLASRYEEARAQFDQKVSEYRARALRNPTHARTPDIVANLQAGFELYLEFGVETDALSSAEKNNSRVVVGMPSGTLRLDQIQPKAVEDWLHTTFDSWWTMHGVRAIMSRIFYYAEGHGLWEEGRRSPASKAKLGKKRHKHERRILSFDETARVLALLDEPHKLIIETCIVSGVRISEVLGLKWKHVDFVAGTIKIEQRVWHQDIDRPKSEDSKRVLGIGDLVGRYRARAGVDSATPDSFVFQQKRAPGRPLWGSGARDALHQAAAEEGCDFPGLGPHSFRRANITWRQQVDGSAIKASKISGHSDLEMTSEYTFVTAERANASHSGETCRRRE